MSMSSWFTGKSGVVAASAASAVTSPVSYASIEDAQESVNKLIGVGKDQYLILKSKIEEGNYSWKTLGATAGAALALNGVLSVIYNLTGLSPFLALLNIYIILFGVVFLMLEMKELMLQKQWIEKKWIDLLRKEALFLYKPYGRSGFYMFVGLLVVAKGGLFDFVIGGYTCAVGGLIYYGTKTASVELNKLKDTTYSEDKIKQVFSKFDSNKDGSLDLKELNALCTELSGKRLTPMEVESALFKLDTNGDGIITIDEFVDWWRNKDDVFI